MHVRKWYRSLLCFESIPKGTVKPREAPLLKVETLGFRYGALEAF